MRSAVALGVAGLVVTLLGACGPTSAHLAIAEAQVALEAARGARAETYAVFEYTSAVEHLRKASEEEGYSDFDAAERLAKAALTYARDAKKRALTRALPGAMPSLGPASTPTLQPASTPSAQPVVPAGSGR
jgi:hypothetical protein